MRIEDMHYDWKSKANAVDSAKFRNYKVPEIDWKLNEAQIIKLNQAFPMIYQGWGFEVNSRSLATYKNFVVHSNEITTSVQSGNSWSFELPSDFFYLVSVTGNFEKDGFTKQFDCLPAQHDDEHEISPFTQSSFEWGESNFTMYDGGVKVYTDGTYRPTGIHYVYVRKPKFMHFAIGFSPQGYEMPYGGLLLTGKQDCEFPDSSHYEIVDLAVALATRTYSDDPNVALQKLQITT